ncbi:MAG TPA: PH domain-containing protein [Sphingomonas sp.]
MAIAIVRGAPSTLLGTPALLAVVARADLWLVLAGTAAALTVGAAFRALSWYRFTYALTGDAVVIESGLFSRNRRTIPYERVADVGIERRPLQRLFGLAAVTLETGGAGGDEGALDSVALAEAERLRDVLRRRRTAVDPRPVATAAGLPSAKPVRSPPDVPIFAMDTRRVLLSGLFNFSLVWIAVGFGALQYVDRALGWDEDVLWNAIVARTGVARSMPALAWAGAAATAVAVVLSIGTLAGLVRTTLRDHGFRLTDGGGRLRRARGLFTRSEAIVSLPRVQLAAIDTGPLRRFWGWSRLRAQVLGGGEGGGGREDLAPFARPDEVDRLLAMLRLSRADPAEMTPVARGHVWRALLRVLGLPAMLIAGASLATPFAWFASPFLLPLAIAAVLGRRHHRYRVASGLLHVQRGVIARTMWIMPIARVQSVTLRRSWLQRRLGLATILVDTAGGGRFGGPDVHDLRLADARTLMANLTGRETIA